MKKSVLFAGIAILMIILIGGILVYKNQNRKDFISPPSNITMKISSVFANEGVIPDKYGCKGSDVNPPLKIEEIPEDAKTLVLIVDDPDAPSGDWVHWVVFNIPISGSKLEIKEDSIPGEEGMNDFKKTNYGGPCPPSGTHRYYFKAYALDSSLGLDFATKKDIEREMNGHVLAKAELMGKYSR